MAAKIKIAKRYTDLEKPWFVNAIDEMHVQGPRGAAIAGTAYLDLALRWSLESVMRDDADIQNKLFENRGALQDFSARIQLSYALGIIGFRIYADLCILRDIRNVFAHSAERHSFEDEDIGALCRKLWFPFHADFQPREKPKSARQAFERSVEIIAFGMFQDRRLWLKRPAYPSTYMQMGPGRGATQPSPKKQKIRPTRDGPAPSRKSGK